MIKLYGEERELILRICNLSESEALAVLAERYNGEVNN